MSVFTCKPLGLFEALPAKKLPRMLPTDVCEFQMPKINPFLPFPNQLATTVTTLGHPVVWKAPPKN